MDWSGRALKLTIGIGSLGITAVLIDAFVLRVGIYVAIAIILVPFTLMVMIKPGEVAGKYVKLAHIIAVLWYLALVIGAVVVMEGRGFIRSDLLMGAFMALGFAPVFMVLKKLKDGSYDVGRDTVEGPSGATYGDDLGGGGFDGGD